MSELGRRTADGTDHARPKGSREGTFRSAATVDHAVAAAAAAAPRAGRSTFWVGVLPRGRCQGDGGRSTSKSKRTSISTMQRCSDAAIRMRCVRHGTKGRGWTRNGRVHSLSAALWLGPQGNQARHPPLPWMLAFAPSSTTRASHVCCASPVCTGASDLCSDGDDMQCCSRFRPLQSAVNPAWLRRGC